MSPEASRPLATILAGVLDEMSPEPDAESVAGRTPAAVLVVLRAPGAEAGDEAAAALPPALAALRVLLIRRPAHLRRHAGEIAFPGGRRDAGDSSFYETALREAEEEIGLARERVLPLGALSVAYTLSTNYAVYPFVALLDDPGVRRAPAAPPPPVPAPGGAVPGAKPPAAEAWRISAQEVDSVLELSLGRLEASRGRKRLTRRGFSFETDVFVIGDDLIWGLTERVLDDLLRRVQGAG